MSREIAERCDICGEFRRHDDLVTVHAAGEAVDVCTGCQASPVGQVLAVARARTAAAVAYAPDEAAE